MRPTTDVLGDRTLNRTLLARQLLLERVSATVTEVLTALVGMQAQEPRDPYLSLRARIAGFRPGDLEQLLIDRRAVRIVLMRGTIHLVTADDCCALRTLFQPVLDYELTIHRDHKGPLREYEMAPVLDAVRAHLAAGPRTQAEIREFVTDHFPGAPAAAAAYAVRNRLPLVQVPPRGLWSASGQVRSTTADSWLGRPVDPTPSIDALVVRYLTAFGPATPGDFTAWSGLKGARELYERLRPRLHVFRDERNRELFDVEDGHIADADLPAPVQFLAEYDNVFLAHRDRTRVVPSGLRPISIEGVGYCSLLVDGYFAGLWHSSVNAETGAAKLTVKAARPLTKRAVATVAAEARRVTRFRHPQATAIDVRVEPPDD